MDGLWLKKQTSNVATKMNQPFILSLLLRHPIRFQHEYRRKNVTMGGIIQCTSCKFKYSLQGEKTIILLPNMALLAACRIMHST